MRVLAVTNVYPTSHAPALGTFVEQQVKGLRQTGLYVDVMFLDRAQQGMRAYLGFGQKLRARIEAFRPDVVHVMYGGVMANEATRTVSNKPTVVTFHGSDLLGEHLSGPLRKLISAYGVRSSWRAARRATGIVIVSKVLQGALPKDVDKSKVRIIPCGIDLERFKPLSRDTCCDQLGWNTDRFHILFPANAGNPVKRPHLARAAVQALHRLGIQAEMHQLQGVPNNEVPIWLNASNVVLLTSLHEGSPTREVVFTRQPVDPNTGCADAA